MNTADATVSDGSTHRKNEGARKTGAKTQAHPASVLARSANKLYTPRKKRRAVISLTPLIDVVFILLVFFMLASSFLDWRSIPLETSLPSTGQPKISEDRPLLVGVSETGTRFNGEVMDMEAILPLLRQRLAAAPGALVRVKPLGDTSLQAVIAVLDRLQADGIQRTTIVRDRAWSDSGEEIR